MTKVVLDEQINRLDDLVAMNTASLSFKNIVSLFFHTVITMTKKTDNDTHTEWQTLLDEFKKDVEIQNKDGWPKLTVTRNDYAKRIDCFCVKPFIKTRNLLTLLLRLLYIENYKIPYVYTSFHYNKILDYVIEHPIIVRMPKSIKNLSIDNIFIILKIYINYFIKIYNDDNLLEYQISKSIINFLDQN